jgi:ABC-type transport system involved in cytochrome c biogenesis permease subunit
MKRKQKMKTHLKYKTFSFGLTILMLLGLGLPVLAYESVSAESRSELAESDEFRQLVILENGRKKPLDTFAQNVLKQFSARGRFGNQAAIQWLARVIFTPEASKNDKVFLVTNPEVLDSMGVQRQGKARDRYSYSQLEPGTKQLRQLAIRINKIDAKKRTFIENEIFSLYNKIYIYQQLTVSLQFMFPHADFAVSDPALVKTLGLPENRQQYSLFDIFEKRPKLLEILTEAEKKKPEELTPGEKTVVQLSRNIMGWTRYYRDLPFTVIPGLKVEEGEKQEKWQSPWDLLTPKADGGIAPALLHIRDFTRAYLNNDAAAFKTAVAAFNGVILKEAGDRVRPGALSWEVFYNKLDPFYKGKFFYGFAALLLMLSFIGLRKWFYPAAFGLLGIGFLLHLCGVIMRMYIMSRPPVTNLYETFVFTGLIVALLGLILELAKKRNIGILTGALAGLTMLMIAGKYALEGDTMGMLVAVLDSNFWLAIHVITIILGYAGVVLSGFLGHVYLLQRMFRPANKELLKNTFQAVYATQAFGVIFTFLGTVLGGIWADQSWGRFWGWDPKENGALLIVLWCAILFHARMAGWLKETGFSLGAVGGNIAVALAWFGVNLLGVGLHSYGFTSGVANTLFIFVVFELLFIFVTGFYLKMGSQKIAS